MASCSSVTRKIYRMALEEILSSAKVTEVASQLESATNEVVHLLQVQDQERAKAEQHQ